MAKQIKVLHVDSVLQDAQRIQQYFHSTQYRVAYKRVETRNEVTRLIQDFVPDVVVTETRLRGFDAPFVLDSAREFSHDLPVIVLTQALSEREIFQYLDKGFWDVILKPKLNLLEKSIYITLRERDRKKAEHQKSNGLEWGVISNIFEKE